MILYEYALNGQNVQDDYRTPSPPFASVYEPVNF